MSLYYESSAAQCPCVKWETYLLYDTFVDISMFLSVLFVLEKVR